MGIRKGFTLVELMVVVAILATVGALAANLFFQTLKGASKAEIEKMVKQEGDYAISVMERMIRNAKSVESATCTGSFASSIQITNQDGDTTTFDCTGIGDDAHIASNTARLTSNKVRVLDCSFVKCTEFASVPPVVEIDFSLAKADASSRPEEQAAVDFKTTVSLRSY